jgi:hypothetical protein
VKQDTVWFFSFFWVNTWQLSHQGILILSKPAYDDFGLAKGQQGRMDSTPFVQATIIQFRCISSKCHSHVPVQAYTEGHWYQKECNNVLNLNISVFLMESYMLYSPAPHLEVIPCVHLMSLKCSTGKINSSCT